MAKILTLDEMLAVLDLCGAEDQVKHYRWGLELIGDRMAADIAERLGVARGPCESEDLAFAGTCAPFRPLTEGQKCPEELADFDSEADWEF